LRSKIFNVPIAIISLVDTDRIWFKSHYGLEINEIDKHPGLCASAISSDDIYLVEDARNDPCQPEAFLAVCYLIPIIGC
jgi:hypothetical protein